jgi:hypothetical protein
VASLGFEIIVFIVLAAHWVGETVDAFPAVELGGLGVVDAGHHVGDLEGLLGGHGHHDVHVVAVRRGGQGLGALDVRLLEDIAVKPHPREHPTAELPRQPPEGERVAVDDDHFVPLGG